MASSIGRKKGGVRPYLKDSVLAEVLPNICVHCVKLCHCDWFTEELNDRREQVGFPRRESWEEERHQQTGSKSVVPYLEEIHGRM